MNMKLTRHLVPALAAAVLAAGLIGCTPSEMTVEGARHEIYSSNDALVASSDAMVTGTVISQSEKQLGDDMAPTTFSEVKVQASYAPEGLGTKLANTSAEQVKRDSTVIVMQFGGKGWETPYQLLQEGKTYLLLLNDSGLSDLQGFYTTGGPAGIFTQTESGFAPTSSDGDQLTPYSTSQLQGIPAH